MVARDPRDKPRLYAAITELAEQDPLINVRQDDIRQEIYVSLYGEVQKQVIEATLATEYGIETGFRETTRICVERPARTGTAGGIPARAGEPVPRHAGDPRRPRPGGRRHRVPARGRPSGSTALHLQEHGKLRHRHGTVRHPDAAPGPLRLAGHRLHGVADQVPVQRSRRASVDSRTPQLTAGLPQAHPLVVMAALKRARTVVCEPVHRFRLETPADTLNILLPVLARLHAVAAVAAAK